MEGIHDPPKGGHDTRVGKFATVSQTVGSIFRTSMSKHFAHEIRIEHTYSFMHNLVNFQATKMTPHIEIFEVKGTLAFQKAPPPPIPKPPRYSYC
jgi:hypothetical protein